MSISSQLSGNPVLVSLRQSFLAGLLALAPLYITFKILAIVFEAVDKPLGSRINAVIQATTGFDVHIPGLGILATVAVVLLIGWAMRLAMFRWALRAVEAMIDRVPLVRSLYNASRQVVAPFTEKDVLPFSEVCLAEYPMKGRWTLGMIARQRISDDPKDDRVVVFFPSNHLHLGYPVVMSRHEVHVIDMTIEEAVKFFVSCGVVGENELFRQKGLNFRPDATPAPAVPRDALGVPTEPVTAR